MIFPSYKNYTSHIFIKHLKKEIKLGNKYVTERMNESNNSSCNTHKLVKLILKNHCKTVTKIKVEQKSPISGVERGILLCREKRKECTTDTNVNRPQNIKLSDITQTQK